MVFSVSLISRCREKIREQRENLREQRLREKELERLKRFEEDSKPIDENLSSGLEKFEIDKTQKN